MPVVPTLNPDTVVVTVPAAEVTPVSGFTVALAFEDDQAIVRPASGRPAASVSVAVAVVDFVTWIVEAVRVTVTVPAVAAVTVTVVVPLWPSLVAVIVAVPGAPPVTTVLEPPDGDTLATEGSLDVQVMTRPVTTVPPAAAVVAVSVAVAFCAMVGAVGAIVTVATGTAMTVTTVVVVFPSLDAVIVAVPAAPPLTSVLAPVVADRLATALLLVDQVITRPVSTLPPASDVVAASVTDWP